MLSPLSRARFSPAVLPNIGTLTTRRTNETSFLHGCSLNGQRRNYSSEPKPCCIGTKRGASFLWSVVSGGLWGGFTCGLEISFQTRRFGTVPLSCGDVLL